MKATFFAILLVIGSVALAADKNPPNWESSRKPMIDISRQLGVTCLDCHNTQNYRDSSKRNFKMAKKHLEMVDMLNNKFKTSFSEKVDCYMCHRGLLKPEFKEKSNKL